MQNKEINRMQLDLVQMSDINRFTYFTTKNQSIEKFANNNDEIDELERQRCAFYGGFALTKSQNLTFLDYYCIYRNTSGVQISTHFTIYAYLFQIYLKYSICPSFKGCILIIGNIK